MNVRGTAREDGRNISHAGVDEPHPLRLAFACVAIIAGAFAVYLSNQETISSYDAAPNSLVAFNIFEHRTMDFDRFRGSYFESLGGGYAFVEAPNGHLTSDYPIGTALITFPVYAALYLIERPPEISLPLFEAERQRDEKLAATTVAAVSVGLLFLCARLIGNRLQAAVATIAFAFGTQTWMIGSQGLWQHGSVNLALLGMIYALQRAARKVSERRRSAWLFGAGVMAGMLPGIRPTALVLGVAGSIFVLTTWRRNRWLFFVAAAFGLAPNLAWNIYFFHSLLGGYGGGTGAYDFSLQNASMALVGLLFSPGRGLVVFTPIVIFSILGAVRATRDPSASGRLLTLLAGAAIVLTLNYALIPFWNGGHCYGPRYLTDIVAVAALLLVYVVPRNLSSLVHPKGLAGPGTLLFLLAFAYSIAVQAVGAYSGAAGPIWNAIPIDIARDPARIWQLSDSPIERNARATYYHYAPDFPTQAPGYAAGFAGHIRTVQGITGAAMTAAPGAKVDLSTLVQNDGPSRWYGYTSGVYNGEARIRFRVFDSSGRIVSENLLYVAGSPATGETAYALGTIDVPASRGIYSAVFDPVALGIPAIGQRAGEAAFHIPLFVH